LGVNVALSLRDILANALPSLSLVADPPVPGAGLRARVIRTIGAASGSLTLNCGSLAPSSLALGET
jgi:hypothetical protein